MKLKHQSIPIHHAAEHVHPAREEIPPMVVELDECPLMRPATKRSLKRLQYGTHGSHPLGLAVFGHNITTVIITNHMGSPAQHASNACRARRIPGAGHPRWNQIGIRELISSRRRGIT
jgi:hypothetical protein